MAVVFGEGTSAVRFDQKGTTDVRYYAKYLGVAAVAFAMTVIVAAPVRAQGMKPEVSGGYQYNRLQLDKDKNDCGSKCGENANGWYGDVAGQIRPMWSWVGQFDGAYKKDAFGERGTTLKLHAYGGGIRVSSTKNSKVTPFGQVVVGGVNAKAGRDSINAFQVTAGGGVNIPVNAKWGIRGEGDYRGLFFKDRDGGTVNVFRAVAGMYFALGK